MNRAKDIPADSRNASPAKRRDSTRRLIERFLQQEDSLKHSDKVSHSRRIELIESQADTDSEIRRRAREGDEQADTFLANRLASSLKPLLKVDLPELPANLGGLTNEELEKHTADVEQRITRFSEFYPHLDRPQSQFVRETLDEQLRALRTERAVRERASRRPAMPDRIEASPPTTGAEAAKKEPAREAARTVAVGSSFSHSVDDERHIKRVDADKREMERLLKGVPEERMRNLFAPLTENEANVARLCWEHKWSVAKIARAMGKHRTTIDETLDRAKTKIDSHCGSKAKMDPHTKSANAGAMRRVEASSMENELIQKIDREKHDK